MINFYSNKTRNIRFLAFLPALFFIFVAHKAVAQKDNKDKIKAWEIKYELVSETSPGAEASKDEMGYLEMAKMMTNTSDDDPVLHILVSDHFIRVAEKGLLANKVTVADKRDSVFYLLDAEAKTAMTYPAGVPKIETGLLEDSLVVISSEDFIFENTKETTKIAGYTCKKTVMKYPAGAGQNAQIIIWHTDKLPQTYWGEYGYLKNVPGAALAILTDMGSYSIGIKATGVQKKEEHSSTFAVPDDFSISNMFGVVEDSIYDYVGPYFEGLAAVFIDYNHGYINKSREVVIPLVYDGAGNFKHGVATVIKKEKYGLINKRGKEITPFKYGVIMDFQDGLAVATLGDKNGFLDTLGNVVVPFKYDGAFNFKNGAAQVSIGDKYGFINTKGREITPIKYELLEDFKDGMARVWLNNKYGFVTIAGKEVVPPIYDWVSDFKDGKVEVRLNDEYFLIDKNGKREKKQN